MAAALFQRDRRYVQVIMMTCEDGARGANPRRRQGQTDLTAVEEEISILIVDDEEPVRRLLSTSLSDRNLCLTAESAEQATRILSQRSINVVLAPALT